MIDCTQVSLCELDVLLKTLSSCSLASVFASAKPPESGCEGGWVWISQPATIARLATQPPSSAPCRERLASGVSRRLKTLLLHQVPVYGFGFGSMMQQIMGASHIQHHVPRGFHSAALKAETMRARANENESVFESACLADNAHIEGWVCQVDQQMGYQPWLQAFVDTHASRYLLLHISRSLESRCVTVGQPM